MRKVKVTRIVARLNVGGPAVHIINLTASLDADRFDNQLIVGSPGPHEGDMGYLATQKGIDPLVIPELGRELSPLSDLRTTAKLARRLRRDRPDIVETHTAKAGAVGRFSRQCWRRASLFPGCCSISPRRSRPPGVPAAVRCRVAN